MAREARDSFGAAGVAVRDLERSVDFYTRVLGMKQLMTFKMAEMDEAVVGFGGPQAAIALMQYTDGSDPNLDNPGKLVFYLVDPAAAAERIRAEGLAVERDPAPVPELGNVVIGLARDPDNILLELLQAPTPKD